MSRARQTLTLTAVALTAALLLAVAPPTPADATPKQGTLRTSVSMHGLANPTERVVMRCPARMRVAWVDHDSTAGVSTRLVDIRRSSRRVRHPNVAVFSATTPPWRGFGWAWLSTTCRRVEGAWLRW